jgi:hypothetical protein
VVEAGACRELAGGATGGLAEVRVRGKAVGLTDGEGEDMVPSWNSAVTSLGSAAQLLGRLG